MDPLMLIFGVALPAVAALAILIHRRRWARKMLREAARELGMNPSPAPIRFDIEGCQARLSSTPAKVTLEVDVSKWVPPGVAVGPMGKDTVNVLDERLDADLAVAGPRAEVFSVMRPQVRAALSRGARDLWPRNPMLEGGRFRSSLEYEELGALSEIERHLRDVIRALSELPEDPAERLLLNYRDDDNPYFKRQNLGLLLEHYEESDAAARARDLARSKGDLDPQGQLSGRLALVESDQNQGGLALAGEAGALGVVDTDDGDERD